MTAEAEGRAPVPDITGALRHRLRQQEILAELGACALRAGELDDLLQEATRLVALGLGTPFSKIMEYRLAEDQLLVRAGVGWREGLVGRRTGADLGSPSGFAFRTGEPVISDHLADDGRFRTPQVLVEHGIHRAINVVIRCADANWGVLEADSPSHAAFEREDLAFIQGAANLLGVAIARKQAELAVRESEERYRLAVRATSDAIWDWDLRTNLVEWNEALHEAYGYAAGKARADSGWWIDRIHPEDRERVRQSIAAVIDGTASRWSSEYRFRRADGTHADVLDRGFMVRGPQGEPRRMIGAMLDVTVRLRAERELRRLNEHLEVEVSRRADLLRQQEATLRQSQKLEAVGQLTGGVAHDFNNLLTIIRSSADLLRRPDLSEERRARYVEAISDTANRAAKLTAQLLAFARRQPLQPEVFAVDERVQAVTDLIRPLVGARIAIETMLECDACAVEADPSQFETALVNLAVNARDAMEDGGRLALRTRLVSELPATRGHAGTPGEFVAVSVTDTGTGIKPELLGRIFEPFFTTKDVGKGTGLGLSQVYGFAKQSGGELKVESEEGRGTAFTLYLPKSEARPGSARATQAVEAGTPIAGRGSVLLVEDNTQVGEFAKQLLDDLGYVATWAPGAQAALRMLEEDPGRFDTVFSDVVMPGMNGVELGQEIRRRWPRLQVILTSGYSHVLAQSGTQGFDLLQKPYSVEALSKALRAGR